MENPTKKQKTEPKVHLLVFSNPSAPELKELKALPAGVKVVGIGRNEEELKLSDEVLASVTVCLNCGIGPNAAPGSTIAKIWPKLKNVSWMHSCSAGVEHLLGDYLLQHKAPLTNARGVYSHSLAEFCMLGCNYFAKDLPRLLRQKEQKKWEKFCVEELRGKTFGIVGYGSIGEACGQLAKAHKMRVIAIKRQAAPGGTSKDNLADALYPPEEMSNLFSESDYVVCALPGTKDTKKMIDQSCFSSMKSNAVFINIGRGSTVDEEALIETLKQGKIKGAVLDVFAEEPLPRDSPLWTMSNVFMSPHCADQTAEFQIESMQFFMENMQRFIQDKPLLNIVDKRKGY